MVCAQSRRRTPSTSSATTHILQVLCLPFSAHNNENTIFKSNFSTPKRVSLGPAAIVPGINKRIRFFDHCLPARARYLRSRPTRSRRQTRAQRHPPGRAPPGADSRKPSTQQLDCRSQPGLTDGWSYWAPFLAACFFLALCKDTPAGFIKNTSTQQPDCRSQPGLTDGWSYCAPFLAACFFLALCKDSPAGFIKNARPTRANDSSNSPKLRQKI